MARLESTLAVLCLASAGIAAAADGVVVEYSEPVRNYTVDARVEPAFAKPTTPGIVDLRFNALGREFVVVLEPNARVEPLLEHLGQPASVAAYRGKLAGRDDSWARIVLTAGGPAGLIVEGSTVYALEVAGDSAIDAVDASAPTIYRLADAYLDPTAITCATDAERTNAGVAFAMLATELTPMAQRAASRNLDLGALADFEFSSNFGASAESALLTRVNNIDGIFSEQVGVQITAAKVDVFKSAADPFTKSAAGALLDEVAVYRGATPQQDALGLTHLFTGRNLDGATAGIAFIGGVCGKRSARDALHRSFGSGLSEARRGATVDSLIAAHEIGHTFGAPHDTENGSVCSSTPATFLMAPTINGSDQFSQCSLEQMQPKLGSASCLTPIVWPDLELATLQPSSHVPVGTVLSYTLAVTNRGAEPATAAALAVTVDNGLNLVAAPEGCSVTAQQATCDLGDIAGGGARQVTLTLRADDPGSYALQASVSSPDDEATTNNALTDTVTADPLVDLVLAGSPGSVVADRQVTLLANLDNQGDFTANGVAITATLSPGLRPDSATLAGAPCTIFGQAVTCPPQALAARGHVVLTLTVTGVSPGAQQVAVAASSGESDSNPADNSLAISVSVSEPPPQSGGGGGGGGALPWWSVLALAGALAARRKALRAD